MKPTQPALRACAEWLSICLKLGWPKSSLDMLQDLWWKYHDHTGQLTKKPAELTGWLQRVPMTWLPGLLAYTVKICVYRKVFQDGKLVPYVSRAETMAMDDPLLSVLREQEPTQ